jgi:2-polyprenyl-6-methoxyphenol hydroxylase-like FAD-dependent oxidoreductase
VNPVPPRPADIDVLVAGAGPTGLTTALELVRHGVGVRIVDRRSAPSTRSRATIVHARTLEYFDRFGVADLAVREGHPIHQVEIYERGRRIAVLPLADPGVEGRTRFPCALSLDQAATERILATALTQAGVGIEWGTSVEAVTDFGSAVTVTLSRDGVIETAGARRVVGADGAASAVRRAVGITFDGTTYPHRGLLADVALDFELPPNRLRLNLTKGGFVGVLPLSGSWLRLFGAVPPGFVTDTGDGEISHESYRDLASGDLQRWFDDYFMVGGTLTDVRWASLFRFHSRIASRFQSGNVFLAGDAAHIHNPAGGQGLNLGVGDAVNLGWKLALVATGAVDEEILSTYESERRSVVETVTRATDRGFALETTANPVALWLRARLAPVTLPLVTRLRPVRRLIFRMFSQTWINYHSSRAVAAKVARQAGPQAGDRAPHSPLGEPTNGRSVLDVLRLPGYQVLMFAGTKPGAGTLDPIEFEATLAGRYAGRVGVFAVSTTESSAHKVFHAEGGRIVVLRPDGHVAVSTSGHDAATVLDHLDGVLVRTSSSITKSRSRT